VGKGEGVVVSVTTGVKVAVSEGSGVCKVETAVCIANIVDANTVRWTLGVLLSNGNPQASKAAQKTMPANTKGLMRPSIIHLQSDWNRLDGMIISRATNNQGFEVAKRACE
jgi:hypothetical protein